ncbi:MAG: D-alanyl-D-alanine carboxypeptidase/D-alanyl-D-alanine-endopeptidase [Bdellovibrionales bacterium]|nr:D-alanyl-D-alanine carboxypeptidase/D-alanyl-D-alanine-endopeptidase [Bdellovibrionales bacterium]
MAAQLSWFAIFTFVVCIQSVSANETNQGVSSDLQKKFDKIIKEKGFSRNQLGLYVSSSREGQITPVYDLNAEKLMIPASLSKVVTAGVALSKLGPNKKFKTQLMINGRVKNGVVEGPLYLKGFGDPGFVSEDLWVLVNDFIRTGVRVIRGGIVVDDTWFDRVRKDPSREGSDVDRAYAAPIGAMSFNWNSVNVYVRPGSRVGKKAAVYADPDNDYIRVVNNTKTVSRRQKSRIEVSRSSGGDSFYGDIVTVSGEVSQKLNEKVVYKSIVKPDLWSGYNLKAFLQRRGIEVEGEVTVGSAPMTARVVAEKEGKPLALVVRDMMKFSNNYVAEMLTKHLAADSGEQPATMETGIGLLQQQVASWGFAEGLKIYNPSGLTRQNKMKAKTLHDFLRLLTQRYDLAPENLASYPVAGLDGTLKGRMKGSAAESWVRAKTGLLNGVSGLAGYAGRQDGSIMTFVFLFNGSSSKTYSARALFDALAISLVE